MKKSRKVQISLDLTNEVKRILKESQPKSSLNLSGKFSKKDTRSLSRISQLSLSPQQPDKNHNFLEKIGQSSQNTSKLIVHRMTVPNLFPIGERHGEETSKNIKEQKKLDQFPSPQAESTINKRNPLNRLELFRRRLNPVHSKIASAFVPSIVDTSPNHMSPIEPIIKKQPLQVSRKSSLADKSFDKSQDIPGLLNKSYDSLSTPDKSSTVLVRIKRRAINSTIDEAPLKYRMDPEFQRELEQYTQIVTSPIAEIEKRKPKFEEEEFDPALENKRRAASILENMKKDQLKYLTKNFQTENMDRIRVFEKFVFKSHEKEERIGISPFLSQMKYKKEGKSTMSIVDLWSRREHKEMISRCNFSKERRVAERFILENEGASNQLSKMTKKGRKNNDLEILQRATSQKTSKYLNKKKNDELLGTMHDKKLISNLTLPKEMAVCPAAADYVDQFSTLIVNLNKLEEQNYADYEEVNKMQLFRKQEKEKKRNLENMIRIMKDRRDRLAHLKEL